MYIVEDATYLGEYKLRLVFDNGAVKVVDLAPYLNGGVFAPLRDTAYFRTVRVDHDTDTITWDNGADIAPEFLYEIGVTVAENETIAA